MFVGVCTWIERAGSWAKVWVTSAELPDQDVSDATVEVLKLPLMMSPSASSWWTSDTIIISDLRAIKYFFFNYLSRL